MAKESSIQMTWSKVWTICGTLVGIAVMALVAFWQINAQVFGDTKEDVREIRSILQKLADEDTTIREIVTGGDLTLREQISQTREIVARNEVAIARVEAGVDGLRMTVSQTAADVSAIRDHLMVK